MIGFAIMAIPLSSAWASDPQRGRWLYENHCLGCHESTDHIEVGRKVDSLSELRHQIVRWSIETGANWRQDDVDAVLEYLNQRHYGFEEEHI
jgi:mono/diheme cytochrome c family protein